MFFTLSKFIKQLFPKTLLMRFTLIIIIPTLIGQFTAINLFYKRHWYNVSQHSSNFISKEIAGLINNIENDNLPKSNQTYLNLSYIYLKNTSLPKNTANLGAELEIFQNILNQNLNYPLLVSEKENNQIKVAIQLNQDLLVITLPAKILLNPTTFIFVLWMLFLTIILLAVSLIFSKNQIKSILALARAADNYGSGKKYANFKPSGAKEIRLAGLALLKMKDRIQRQALRRTQMLAMISHDLRTPLTRMKLQVELMEDNEEKEELKHDIETMQYMLNAYLDFVRGEQGEASTELELSSWLKEYIATNWNHVNITSNFARGEFKTKLKPRSFKRAIGNLLENAKKHANEIRLSLYSENKQCVITIEDNGKGIKDSDKDKLFDPFYRGDESRKLDDSSSVGLGLTITKEIINNNNGNITLEDSTNLGGLMVKITIPKI